MYRNPVALVMLLFGSANLVQAQTSYPMITHLHPVAVQRGRNAEVVVEGKMNFAGAYKVLVEGRGVHAEVVPQKETAGQVVTRVKVKMTVAPDAPLGVREFRVACSLGLSSIGQLVVVDEPVIAETSVNNTLAQAQGITLPCVVAGKLEVKEDVDYYKFEADAGQVVSFELFCARLQDKIHDLQNHAKPMLVLHDSEGRELAANDTFFFADPMLSYRIPQKGTYYIQVRESTYDGDPRWVYALLATNRPYASHVYPLAGNPGQKVEVELLGSAASAAASAPGAKGTVTVPPTPGIVQVQVDTAAGRTNPVTFIASPLPLLLEQEGNDTPQQAQRFTIPAGINGRLGKKRDLDHYAFAARKGQAIRFEVKARRFGTLLNSTVHAVIDILTPDGKLITGNDDTHGKEAALVFTPPADGTYVLRIRDLNSKGGETAVYFIEADFARPDFTLRCDPDLAMIGPGTSMAWFVHVVRHHGFAGPVQVEVKGLPPGVTASPLTIPPSMTQGAVILTADANAQVGVANVEMIGTATVKDAAGKEEQLTRRITPNQEIYLPGGGRGRFDVNLHTVAVTTPSDILKVEVSKTMINLKPGEEVKIEVTVHRRPDYTKGVNLDILLRHLNSVYGDPLPPGVTMVPGKSQTLLGTGNKGWITLKAAANAAPIDNVPMAVLAQVSINFVVKISYASPPILVSVSKK